MSATLTTSAGVTSNAVSVRLVTPSCGTWFADVDLDPDDATVMPSGRCTLTVASTAMPCTVDPRGSGRFLASQRVRLVGGGGGWDKPVTGQHFHADSGVQSTQVYQATASLVGETVNQAVPTSLGADYVRSAGPASRVLAGLDWYVDASGITQIASRPAATPDASLEILDFDPIQLRVMVSCDALIVPGTALRDPRFDGTIIVRDVEQTFAPDGARATLWCSSTAATRLVTALQNMVRELGGLTYLRVARYRFVLPSGPKLQLQIVDQTIGLPDILPVNVWPGLAGLSAKYTPGQTVIVAFLEGDPKQPVVIGFDQTLPLESTIDATVTVHVGPSAPLVALAGGSTPLVLATAYQSLLSALTVFAGAMTALTSPPLTPIGTAGGVLQTALAALPPPATLKTVAA